MKPEGMNDKERILLHIIRAIVGKPVRYRAEDVGDDTCVVTNDLAAPGDVIISLTTGLWGGPHPWMVGVLMSHVSDGAYVVRDLASDATCRVSNDMVNAVRGLDPEMLLTGERWQVRRKVQEAFRRGDEHAYRYGGISFEADAVVVRVREVFNGRHGDGTYSLPFEVRVPLTRRISVKTILTALRAGGYGTRAFERTSAAGA